MRFTPGLLLFLLLLSNLSPVHGILETYYTSLKCKCPKMTSAFIHLQEIERFEISPPGNGCPRKEIIVWKKNGNSVCVNPHCKWIKAVWKVIQKLNVTPAPQTSMTKKKNV